MLFLCSLMLVFLSLLMGTCTSLSLTVGTSSFAVFKDFSSLLDSMHDIWLQWGNSWLHGEACYFFHFSLCCSQFAGSWAENRILRFSVRSGSPETTTIIKVGSGFVLEASSAFCTQNFLKGNAGSQNDRKWKCYPDPCFPQGKTLALLKLDFFLRYWCKQTTTQLYFLFCDVKCHNSSQSFKKCHDTHKNSQLRHWKSPGTAFSPKTFCYILHEKLLQMHVSKVLPSVSLGSYDIAGLTLVNFSSNWNKIKCLYFCEELKENRCDFNSKGRIIYCYMNMRRFI